MRQTDDEEALKDEGEEALRLQRAAAEALHAEDFEQVSEPETSEDEDEDDGIETLGNMAAAGVSPAAPSRTSGEQGLVFPPLAMAPATVDVARN